MIDNNKEAPLIFPSLKGPLHHPCGHGPVPAATLMLDEVLFSDLSALTVCDVLRNGQQVHCPLISVLQDTYGVSIRTVSDVERIARNSPDLEWLVRFIEPLQSRVYQRHGDGKWNLVRIGSGMF